MRNVIEEQELGRARRWYLRARPRAKQARSKSRYRTPDPARKSAHKRSTRSEGVAMKWFRFYSEVLNDPKVQQLRPELFKFWVNCLCLANEQPARGTIPTIAEIAFIMRMKRPVVDRFVRELTGEELLHRVESSSSGDQVVNGSCDVSDGSPPGDDWLTARFMIHAWSARQRHWDDSAPRAKAFRKHSSGKKVEEAKGPPSRDAIRDASGSRHGLDSDTDSEADTEKENPPASHPPQGGGTQQGLYDDVPVDEKRGSETKKPMATPDRSPKPKLPPQVPNEDDPLKAMPGPYPMDRTDLEDIWYELWRAFGKVGICKGFYAHQKYFPASTWKEAIQRALRTGSDVYKIGYVERFAADIPAPRLAGATAPRPSAESFTERRDRERREKVAALMEKERAEKEARHGCP